MGKQKQRTITACEDNMSVYKLDEAPRTQMQIAPCTPDNISIKANYICFSQLRNAGIHAGMQFKDLHACMRSIASSMAAI